ncbi:hypothetical protein EJ08DRAFT_644609 [Tothia fuscella]|uniref:Receptor L-domain domain-containing protein n=1 Tax=Tothia fuscella TaxID=1048955 RepID=A0A9P4P2H9_9PEZI|nr:hypothetical protein EJ08DRAFT_644609 [Tothia fuscella]
MRYRNIRISLLYHLFATVVGRLSSVCGSPSSTLPLSAPSSTSTRGCDGWLGDIVVATTAQGIISVEFEEIQGDLIFINAPHVSGFNASKLKKLGGDLHIAHCSNFTEFLFPELASVGNIIWNNLTSTRRYTLDFTAGITSANSVRVEDTTMGLGGFNLQVAQQLIIQNNPRLGDLRLPLNTIYTELRINGSGFGLLDLSLLTTTGDTILTNWQILNLDKLLYVSGTMQLLNKATGNGGWS